MRRCLLVLLALSACPGPGTNGSTGTTEPTGATTGDQPTGSTTDACLGSGDCDSEGICVADYEAVDSDPPAGMRDAAECVEKTQCITALDLDRWCFDHRSCCESLRCHPADGTCEPRDLGETTGTTGATTTSTSGDTTGDTTTGTTGDTTTGTTGPGTGSSG